ncbi:MAG: hypothetical protein AAB336_09650, partial [Acidobacteriota bacterium]
MILSQHFTKYFRPTQYFVKLPDDFPSRQISPQKRNTLRHFLFFHLILFCGKPGQKLGREFFDIFTIPPFKEFFK